MNNTTLLIVDDEESILRALQRLFRKLPYHVVTANSPKAALEVLTQHPVAVILCDQRMPEMTGSELLKHIKKTHPHTIRIVMSGYTEMDSITAAINDGAIFKFLTKPWNDDQLLEHIREAFEIYQLRRQREQLADALIDTNRDLNARLDDLRSLSSIQQSRLSLAQTLIEHLPVTIFCVDTDGLVVLANASARRSSQTDLVGRLMNDVLPEPLVTALQQMFPRDEAPRPPSMNVVIAERVYQLIRLEHPEGPQGVIVTCLHESGGVSHDD